LFERQVKKEGKKGTDLFTAEKGRKKGTDLFAAE
jgi:hypothetical protein